MQKKHCYMKDENMHRIYFSDQAQIGQIHGIKYYQILILKLQLYKLSLRDS